MKIFVIIVFLKFNEEFGIFRRCVHYWYRVVVGITKTNKTDIKPEKINIFVTKIY